MPPRGGGKTADEYRAFYEALDNNQQITETCGLCGWTYTGPFCEGRTRYDQHMHDQHPRVKLGRRKRAKSTEQARARAAARAADLAASFPAGH